RLLEPLEVGDGGIGRTEDRALEGGGEEAAVEVVEAADGDEPAVEDDEAGKVLVVAAQAVADPRAHAGASLQSCPGVEEVVRAGVLREGGRHRSDHAEV